MYVLTKGNTQRKYITLNAIVTQYIGLNELKTFINSGNSEDRYSKLTSAEKVKELILLRNDFIAVISDEIEHLGYSLFEGWKIVKE